MNLNVPVLSAQPLIVAETRPAKIIKFLSALPVTNALETALALQDELEILNRQKVAPDTRIKALETYRPAVISATESLASHYCTTALPLPEQEKQYALIANTLWAEIAFGYKLALIDLEAKLFKFGSNKLLALSLQRALDALRMQIVIYYETYRAHPRSLWAELHQIFSLARERDLADQEIDAGNQAHEVSISHIYKQALMLSLTDPQHLSPREIKLVCDYIMRFAHLAQLQPANNLDNTAAIFLVSTGRDKPPVPLSKRLRNIDAEKDLLLLTMDIARQVHLHIKQGQSGPFPPGAGLPDSANQPRYLDLLNYLLRHWGAAPKRIYTRTPKQDGIELVIGLPAIHRVLSNQAAVPAENGVSSISRPLSSRWQVLNISAGGMALRKLPAAEVQVHVGDLVCIKINPTSHWALGVLRWANHTENRHLDIGLQMLAPEASAVSVLSATLNASIPMLLLPEIPVIKQTASLIGNPGSYGPAKILDIEQEDGMQRIMITRLIERTNHFDHFQFSPL